MPFTPEQIKELEAPLNRGNVKKNPRGFDYVEAWWAISEANRIFGHGGWERQTIRLEETNRDLVELTGKNGPYKQWRVGYVATVRITAGGVVREGTGYGSGMSKPEALGEAVEGAAKEAESDAMKRALMTFGNPFGLALYDKEQANVAEPLSLACQEAERMMRSKSDPAEFRTFWETNKAGWKDGLTPREYAHLVGVMQEIAATFKPKDAAA